MRVWKQNQGIKKYPRKKKKEKERETHGIFRNRHASQRRRALPLRHEPHGGRAEKDRGKQARTDPLPALGHASQRSPARDRSHRRDPVLLRHLRHDRRIRQLRHDEGAAGGERRAGRHPRHLHHRLDHLPQLYGQRRHREHPLHGHPHGSGRRLGDHHPHVREEALGPPHRRHHDGIRGADVRHESSRRCSSPRPPPSVSCRLSPRREP